MFRERDPQVSLWQSEFLVPPKKARRLERSWAEVFRNEALPLIDEERFAPMYCADNGRPNRAVQTVLGVHLLKEMFNLTDDEALEQLEFNLLWHHALRLDMEETHLPQKTLHNFRVRLMQHDGGRLAFQETTERIIQALGIRTGKQRLELHPHHEQHRHLTGWRSGRSDRTSSSRTRRMGRAATPSRPRAGGRNW